MPHWVRNKQLTFVTYVMVAIAIGLILIVLPREIGFGLLGLALLISTRAAITIPLHKPLPILSPRPPFAITKFIIGVAEVMIIAAVIWHFGVDFRNVDPNIRPPGDEFSYLTNSGAVAYEFFTRTGFIPLWNPLLGFGEPLVDGPFSYIYNPLMMWPVLLSGPVQGGKIVILLHMAVMAYGGYALGWALRLKTPGRLLLALLLLGSGSMVGGLQHYQMGMSQAYIPWVFASLIWVIRRDDRWAIGLLVVSSVLLISAGTYWYVLPTIIGAVLITAFHIAKYDPKPGLFVIDWLLMRRLAWAAALVLLIGAVRWLPTAVNQHLIYHPLTVLGYEYTFAETFELYFVDQITQQALMVIFYHFVIPISALLILVSGRVYLVGDKQTPTLRWQIVIPATLLLLVFTLWGEARHPIIVWLYDNIPLISEWRFPQRMLAAGSFWLLVIAAICFDDILCAAVNGARRNFLLGGVGLAVLIVGGSAAFSVVNNWSRAIGTIETRTARPELMVTVQNTTLEPIRMVDTLLDFYDYLPLYASLTRATLGNPDYRPFGAKPTIGPSHLIGRFTPNVVAQLGRQTDWLVQQDYDIIDSSRRYDQIELLWYSERMLTYAFTVPQTTLQGQINRLRRVQTTPITTYNHMIDAIVVNVPVNRHGDVLVLREVNYPGWSVTVNGRQVALESVDGNLAVRLPDNRPVQVVFRYRPSVVFVGSGLSLIGIIIMIAYLLRLDNRLKLNRLHSS